MEANAPKDPRGHAQWVIIVLKNVGSIDIVLKNLTVSWGKLHANGNKDKEIPPSEYEGSIIRPNTQLQLNASGREFSPSGTTGEFDLVDPSENNKVIRHFYWDCPGGSTRNTWTITGSNSKFLVESSGENLNGGALRTITVEVLNRPGKRVALHGSLQSTV